MASIANTKQTTEEASSSTTTASSASVEATAPPAAEAAPQTFPSPSEASEAALKSLKEAGTKEEYDAASTALKAAINRLKTQLKICNKAAGLKFPDLTVLKKGQVLANPFDGNVYVAEKVSDIPSGVSFYDHSGKLHPCRGMDEKKLWKKALEKWLVCQRGTLGTCTDEFFGLFIKEQEKQGFIKDGHPTDKLKPAIESLRLKAERDVLDEQKQQQSRELDDVFIGSHEAVAFAFAQDGKVYYSTESEQLTVYRKWQSFHLKADPEMLYPREKNQRKRGGNGSAKKRRFQPTPKRKNENHVKGTMCSTRNTNGKGKRGCPVQSVTMFPLMEKVIETFFAKRGNEEYKGFLSKQGDFFTQLKNVTEPDLRKAFTLTSTAAEPEKKFCARCHVAKLFDEEESSLYGMDEPYLISLIVHSANLEVWLKGLRNKSTYKFDEEFEGVLRKVAKKIHEDTSEYGKRMKLAALFVHFTKYYVRKQKAKEGEEMAANWQGYSLEEYKNEKKTLAEISAGSSAEPQVPPKRPRTEEGDDKAHGEGDEGTEDFDKVAAEISRSSPTNEEEALRQLEHESQNGSGNGENDQQQSEADVQMAIEGAMGQLTDALSDSASSGSSSEEPVDEDKSNDGSSGSSSSSNEEEDEENELQIDEEKAQAEGNVEEEEVLLKSVIGYLNKNFNVQNTLKTWHNVKDVLKKEKDEFNIKDLKFIAGLLDCEEKLGKTEESHYKAVMKTMKLRHLNWACRKANVEEIKNLKGWEKMTKDSLKEIGPYMYEGLDSIMFNTNGKKKDYVKQITTALK